MLETISFTIQHLKPENIPRPPYSLSSAPVDITASSSTEATNDSSTASSTAKGKQPATPKAAQAAASTPASKPTSKKPASSTGTEGKQQKPSKRPLPVPPTPYPPLSSRISQYSPALSSGVLIETVKAGMNAAPAEGALPGMPGVPAGMGKGKRKVVRVRG